MEDKCWWRAGQPPLKASSANSMKRRIKGAVQSWNFHLKLMHSGWLPEITGLASVKR